MWRVKGKAGFLIAGLLVVFGRSGASAELSASTRGKIVIQPESISQAIADFLRAKGVQDLPQNLSLDLPSLAAAQQAPLSLQVVGADWDYRRHALQFRMRCINRDECGNFLVWLRLPDSTSDHLRQRLNVGPRQDPSAADPVRARTPVLVARGRPALLVLTNNTSRITIPVVCLDEGRLHEQVRVFDRRSRRVSRAEVIGGDLVRANM